MSDAVILNREGHRDFDVHWAWDDGRVHSGMTAVLRVRGSPERLRFRQIANHGTRPARGDARRLVVVAHERRHVVPAAHERVENGRTNVSSGAREENPHEGRISYSNRAPRHVD